MTRSQHHLPTRSGLAAVWVVIVLAVVSVFMVAAVARFGNARKQAIGERNRDQVEWLARSGYELAVDRLLANPDGYTGEKVTLIPESEITIVVRKHAKKADVYQVDCEARYLTGPSKLLHKTQRSLKLHKLSPGYRVESLSTNDP